MISILTVHNFSVEAAVGKILACYVPSKSIFCLGIGNEAPVKTLKIMARETDGVEVIARQPSDAPELLASIMNEFNDKEQITSEEFLAAPTNSIEHSFIADPSLGTIEFECMRTNATTNQNVFDVELITPSGEIIPVEYESSIPRYFKHINNPDTGMWKIRLKNTSPEMQNAKILVYASPSEIVPRIKTVEKMDTDNFILEWGLNSDGLYYTDLNVIASVHYPDGKTVQDLVLFDDGENGDKISGDGIYTFDLSTHAYQSGFYKVIIRCNNRDLNAETSMITDVQFVPAPDVDENGFELIPEKLGYNVERVSIFTFHIEKINPTGITLTPSSLSVPSVIFTGAFSHLSIYSSTHFADV
jgi:hypothetical protein